MSLTKPSSPSSGTAQKGQMAWNASQPWGMGTCCQNLKQSKMLIGKQQQRNQNIETWLNEIQAKLNSRQCWLAIFFTPDYQKRSNSFAGADEFFYRFSVEARQLRSGLRSLFVRLVFLLPILPPSPVLYARLHWLAV